MAARKGLLKTTAKRGMIRELVRRGTAAGKVALPSKRRGAPAEPAVCSRCGEIYRRKTWRAGERSDTASLVGASWTVCPACRQTREGEYFGRVTLRGPISAAEEAELRRRVENVEARAQFTQPERRVVSFERTRGALVVLTTSQKLAHRIAREVVKLYGGNARYSWSDRDGALDAVWEREPAGRTSRRAPRRRSTS